MNIFRDEFVLTSTKSSNSFIKSLEGQVDVILPVPHMKYFYGKVSENNFEISISGLRPSMLPVFVGTVDSKSGETSVRVKVFARNGNAALILIACLVAIGVVDFWARGDGWFLYGAALMFGFSWCWFKFFLKKGRKALEGML